MKPMEMLDQLENVMIECEKAPRYNSPTMHSFIALLRVVYFLLERWIREHDKA